MIGARSIARLRLAGSRRYGRACALVTAALCIASGCSEAPDGRLAVSGAVTLDDAALDQGVITFVPVDQGLPSAGAVIAAGEYEIPAEKGLKPGAYRVAIDSADSSATARPDTYTMEIPVSRIPLHYNGETTLTAQITADGDNEFDFALETGLPR